MHASSRRLPSAEEIRSTLREVDELDGELRTLTSQIKFLQQRVSELQEKRAQRISFIAPFRRLPQDILVKVARICIDAGDSPNDLNRICSSMRQAVNSMKALWGTIHLVPYRSDQRRVTTDDEESHGRLSRRGKIRDPQRPAKRSHKVLIISSPFFHHFFHPNNNYSIGWPLLFDVTASTDNI